jgi:hypothetical protein
MGGLSGGGIRFLDKFTMNLEKGSLLDQEVAQRVICPSVD